MQQRKKTITLKLSIKTTLKEFNKTYKLFYKTPLGCKTSKPMRKSQQNRKKKGKKKTHCNKHECLINITVIKEKWKTKQQQQKYLSLSTHLKWPPERQNWPYRLPHSPPYRRDVPRPHRVRRCHSTADAARSPVSLSWSLFVMGIIVYVQYDRWRRPSLHPLW